MGAKHSSRRYRDRPPTMGEQKKNLLSFAGGAEPESNKTVYPEVAGRSTKATAAPAEIVFVSVPKEKYCGPITWIIGIFLLPCICFCPVDERDKSGAAYVPQR